MGQNFVELAKNRSNLIARHNRSRYNQVLLASLAGSSKVNRSEAAQVSIAVLGLEPSVAGAVQRLIELRQEVLAQVAKGLSEEQAEIANLEIQFLRSCSVRVGCSTRYPNKLRCTLLGGRAGRPLLLPY